MRHQKSTIARIEKYASQGYQIIEGNNWRLNRAKKYAKHHCIRLAQTNSRLHGKSINTVWAVRPTETV